MTLKYLDNYLLVEVTDDGRGAAAAAAVAASGDAAGHGLTGMRERIALYGGTVQAGPLARGGYRVSARLPYAGPAPEPARAAGTGLAGRALRQGDAA